MSHYNVEQNSPGTPYNLFRDEELIFSGPWGECVRETARIALPDDTVTLGPAAGYHQELAGKLFKRMNEQRRNCNVTLLPGEW